MASNKARRITTKKKPTAAAAHWGGVVSEIRNGGFSNTALAFKNLKVEAVRCNKGLVELEVALVDPTRKKGSLSDIFNLPAVSKVQNAVQKYFESSVCPVVRFTLVATEEVDQ